MKKPYIAIHDYQHGSVAYRIFAECERDVEAIFPPPVWDVLLEWSPGCRQFRPDLTESDIDQQESWLQHHIYILNREREGKHAFNFRSRETGSYMYWEVWARSEAEVLDRFPWMESMLLKPMNAEMLFSTRLCDIDQANDFLQLNYDV